MRNSDSVLRINVRKHSSSRIDGASSNRLANSNQQTERTNEKAMRFAIYNVKQRAAVMRVAPQRHSRLTGQHVDKHCVVLSQQLIGKIITGVSPSRRKFRTTNAASQKAFSFESSTTDCIIAEVDVDMLVDEIDVVAVVDAGGLASMREFSAYFRRYCCHRRRHHHRRSRCISQTRIITRTCSGTRFVNAVCAKSKQYETAPPTAELFIVVVLQPVCWALVAFAVAVAVVVTVAAVGARRACCVAPAKRADTLRRADTARAEPRSESQ